MCDLSFCCVTRTVETLIIFALDEKHVYGGQEDVMQ